MENNKNNENKNTIVIAAFPCCGKTVCVQTLKGKYSMIDSDSSKFSWIWEKEKDIQEDGTIIWRELGKTNIRNPDFPRNYINHIKENLGKYDFIFVSTHKQVRDALRKENINYTLVFPANTSENKCLWTQRMNARGNDEIFKKTILNNWDEMIASMEEEMFPVQYILGYKDNGHFLDETALNNIMNRETAQD